jgi:hypothetical protein
MIFIRPLPDSFIPSKPGVLLQKSLSAPLTVSFPLKNESFENTFKRKMAIPVLDEEILNDKHDNDCQSEG